MEWFGKPVFHCASDYRVGGRRCAFGGVGGAGGSPLGRQACEQDRHTERGKNERQGSAIYSQR